MKMACKGIWAMALLSVIPALQTAQGQTVAATAAKPAAGPFSYDNSKEVTLAGTVSKVLTQALPGTVPGAHLLLTTSSGLLDVSLGTVALRGEGALSVEPGQQVRATGVSKTLRGGSFFLARTVTVGNQVYAIRNEHGVLVSPQARVRASQKNSQKSVTGNPL
jgi:hypothetical protein